MRTATRYGRVLTLLLGLLGLLLAGCTSTPGPDASGTPTVESGIEGTVLAGPACPGPVRVGVPCPDRPVQMKLRVLDTNNTVVARGQSDTQGAFRIAVPPGRYRVLSLDSGLPRLASDEVIEVRPGHFTQVSLHADTGIR